MNKGLYRVQVVKATFPNTRLLGSGEVFIELKLGEQKKSLRGQGYDFKSTDFGQVTIFDRHEDRTLKIYAHEHQGGPDHNGDHVVYGEINLADLQNQPGVKHIVNVHCVFKDKEALKQEEAGLVEVEIYYTESLNGVLEIKVESAILERDTEVVGKMDPFAQLIVEGVTKRTTVKQEAGKMPIWNEFFVFEVNNPQSKLDIVVKDQDVTTNDLVGSNQLSLRHDYFLQPSEDYIGRGISLFYKGAPVGTVNVLSRFTFRS